MKIAILYFSGTGVTAKFALDIAKGFKENGHKTTLFRLKKGLTINTKDYDLFGLGAPAYSFRAPRFATNLIKELNFHNKPFFVFCTSHGSAGFTLWSLYRAGKRKAGECLGHIEAKGVLNIRSWLPQKDSEKKLFANLTGNSHKEINNFVTLILERFKKKNNTKQKRSWRPNFRFWSVLWSPFLTLRWQMAFLVGRKKIDLAKCTKCKLCATKICPSGAITLKENNTPKIDESRCVGCNGCVNLCPTGAIWSRKTRKHQRMTKYSNYILKD
jgi:Pyruvate/2-oxoacid:ferredoxin oxidoreductase delta subunit/flavodoxin